LAQVNGRNAVNWEEKFAYDIEYVNKITFWGDVKIIFLSVKTALKREDIGTRGIDAPVDFDVYRRNQLEEGSVKA
jgi:lipopolysaccharide/colanic/teichoic acid biosynthesis glycosyltransferase